MATLGTVAFGRRFLIEQMMSSSKQPFPDDKTASERRKDLDDSEIEDLELAGGVEGGMQAGRGGPPPDEQVRKDSAKADGSRSTRKPDTRSSD